jgi:hypothetical protein
VTAVRCQTVPLPSAYGLTWDQTAGRACVSCGKPLTTGAVPRGRVQGNHGAHVLNFEVWSCPDPEERPSCVSAAAATA